MKNLELFFNNFFKKNRSHSPNKSKKFKQDNHNYSNSNHLQLTDELFNHFNKAKQLETTYTLKWKLCQDLFSMFVGIVPSKISTK
jgi:YesN/AraC family two-component response regulator